MEEKTRATGFDRKTNIGLHHLALRVEYSQEIGEATYHLRDATEIFGHSQKAWVSKLKP